MFEEIQYDFNRVINYSQDIPNPKTNELFQRWRDAKSHYFKMFNGKLIHEVGKVSFELELNSKVERYRGFQEWVEQFEDLTGDLTNFLASISTQEFYDNALEDSYTNYDLTIPKGSKIVKSFKYFISDERLLRDLQDKASEIIQENKVEGTLCFSIHPLDFLSLSENQFHWRSCHALDGDYRCGNLSYMVDPHTIICYLKSDKDTVLPHFPKDVEWNNKKWRCLLFIDDPSMPEVIFAGRQYPFFSNGALNIIKQHLIPLFPPEPFWREPPRWTNWYGKSITSIAIPNTDETMALQPGLYYPIAHHIVQIKDWIEDAENSRHYNDLLYSSCYEPHYFFNNFWNSAVHFRIGGAIKCLRCGEEEVSTNGTMMCPQCELDYGDANNIEYYYCDNCGCRHLAELTVWVDDDKYCPECVETDTFVCETCGCRHNNSEKRYIPIRGIYVCEECYEEEDKIG